MITQTEARQRCAINRMSMRRVDGEFRINFIERDNEATAYYTDDLDDVVLTAASMRRRMNDQVSRKFVAHA